MQHRMVSASKVPLRSAEGHHRGLVVLGWLVFCGKLRSAERGSEVWRLLHDMSGVGVML